MALPGPWVSLGRLAHAARYGAVADLALGPGSVFEAGLVDDARSAQGQGVFLLVEVLDAGAHGFDLEVIPVAFTDPEYERWAAGAFGRWIADRAPAAARVHVCLAGVRRCAFEPGNEPSLIHI